MSSALNNRKQDHLRIIRHDADTDRRKLYFDAIRLVHRALPEISRDDVDPRMVFMGRTLAFPLLIAGMTGGSGAEILEINGNLAAAAEATGVAMGTGSQRIMLEEETARESFMLRSHAPSALLFGNLGAVQLNLGVTPGDCRRLVREIGADALCLHLNPLQEAVQPGGGDTCFRGLADRIGEVVAALDVPVIVKEVGAGIGIEDARLLLRAGVRFIDVAGAGGTSWSRIEHCRDRANASPGLCFQDWGLPTPDAIRQLAPLRDQISIIASGGVRTGIDMVKAMILGASLCGVARPFLESAAKSADAVIEQILKLKSEFQTAMFLLGVETPSALLGRTDLILTFAEGRAPLPPALFKSEPVASRGVAASDGENP